ncbi:MAG TPA: hypothetical protein VF142_16000 [Longimicrobium sp.]
MLDEFERILRVMLKAPSLRVSADLSTSRAEVRHEDDKLVLASAISSGAEVLVTGDRDLLSIAAEVTELQIVEPRTLWELLGPRQA